MDAELILAELIVETPCSNPHIHRPYWIYVPSFHLMFRHLDSWLPFRDEIVSRDMREIRAEGGLRVFPGYYGDGDDREFKVVRPIYLPGQLVRFVARQERGAGAIAEAYAERQASIIADPAAARHVYAYSVRESLMANLLVSVEDLGRRHEFTTEVRDIIGLYATH